MIEASIGELCEIVKGETGIMKAIPGQYPLVVTGADRKSSSTFQFDDEAVCIPLVSSTGHGHKSLNYVHYQSGKFALGTILAAVIPKDKSVLSAEYLQRYLQFNKDRVLVPLMTGAANVTLSMKNIAKVSVPIPSIEKQHKYIDLINRIEKQQLNLNTEFNTQSSYLTQLRQAILQEAIEGKLTADWRKENPVRKGDSDYDAEALLEKIKAEKEKLVKEGKIKKQKPLAPIKPEEMQFDLPEGWVWTRFGKFTTLERGRFSIRPRNDKSCFGGEYPFIQIGSLNETGHMIVDFEQTLNEKGYKASKEFPKGTILVAIVGGTIGNLGVLGRDMCFPDSIIGIRPSIVRNNSFVLLLLRYLQPVIRKAAYQMAGQPNIKIPTLSELVVTIPPLAEQQAIVERVEKLLSMVEELEKYVSERKEQSEQLMQAVLREVFEGGS